MASSKRVISGADFNRDLRRGHRGEDVAEEFFFQEYGLITKNVSERNPDFDLIISGVDEKLSKRSKVSAKKLLKNILKAEFNYKDKTDFSIEVKLDEAAARYKNFFVEIFFNREDGSPGTAFKCKADILTWIVPHRKNNYSVYVFKRAEFLAWVFDYIINSKKKVEYKTPGISPYARGVAIPIKDAIKSVACVGAFDFVM